MGAQIFIIGIVYLLFEYLSEKQFSDFQVF